MQNGDTDPNALSEQLRYEVRKRKLALQQAGPEKPEASSAVNAPAPIALPQTSTAETEQKPRLRDGKDALNRAASKNAGASGWPRFLRGLRRNQEAVNEGLIKVARIVLETLGSLHRKTTLLDSRWVDLSRRQQEQGDRLQGLLDGLARQMADQKLRAETEHEQFTELDRRMEQQARRATEDEVIAAEERQRLQYFTRELQEQAENQQKQLVDLNRKLDELAGEHEKRSLALDQALSEHAGDWQKQVLDLNYKLLAHQNEVTERFERATTQLLQNEKQLIDLHTVVSERERQSGNDQRQLSEVQSFVNAQQQQNAENARLFGEHQRQMTEIRTHLEQTGVTRNKLEELNNRIAEYQNDACARYHLAIEALEQEMRQVAEVRSRIEDLKPGDLPGSSPIREIEVLRNKVNAMEGTFKIIEERLTTPESAESIEAVAPAIKSAISEHENDAFYLAFENQFRGSRELIKTRLRFYVPIIERVKATTGNASAVDLGCGRGEWLELQEHGFECTGVDLNVCMIEECRSLGLKVALADAIAYLRGLDPGSVSLVTGFHIVEHLSSSQLVELFQETFRVLCPSGMAIFETPNPETSHVTGYSFYLDPTHRHPIPQELLCFVASHAGFEGIRVERLQAYLERGVFKGYLDYAGIFTK